MSTMLSALKIWYFKLQGIPARGLTGMQNTQEVEAKPLTMHFFLAAKESLQMELLQHKNGAVCRIVKGPALM